MLTCSKLFILGTFPRFLTILQLKYCLYYRTVTAITPQASMYIAEELRSKVNALFNELTPNMDDTLGIEYKSFEPERIVATMPVTSKTKQPFGYLHGGASVALAETLCSIGSWLHLSDENHIAIGLEINANHLRPVKEGEVRGIATPIKTGQNIHVWQAHIYDNREKLISVSRCTLAIVNRH